MTEHPLLAAIRAGIAATRTHSAHWGNLRREAFPGPTAWRGLKAWCAENAFECELAFGQSSRDASVQFRALTKAAAAAAARLPP